MLSKKDVAERTRMWRRDIQTVDGRTDGRTE